VYYGTCSWKTRISCRWQTRAKRCITASVLQTNKVDAQCDKLATKLSWKRFASKFAILQLPHLHLTYSTCIWRLGWSDVFEFCRDFRRQKAMSPWRSVVCVILRLAVSVEPSCDKRTDGQTDTRRQLIPAPASVARVMKAEAASLLEISSLRITVCCWPISRISRMCVASLPKFN